MKRFIERQKLAAAVAIKSQDDDQAIDHFLEKMLSIGHRYSRQTCTFISAFVPASIPYNLFLVKFIITA